MKKQILLLLAAVLLSMASSFAQGGTTGSLTWNINNGVLTISGEGAMPDYSYDSGRTAPWKSYSLYFDAVNIEFGVTSIGDFAFYYCEYLISATISNSVFHIGDAAFSNCTSLISITLPNSVTSIGSGAFANCSSLITISLPNSVASIGDNAFIFCTNMTSIEVESENDIYTSDNGVLIDKSKGTLVRYPEGKTGVYIVPNSVMNIGKLAFFNCQNLTSIIIPNSVLSIGNEAFSYCTNLISVNLPNSITSIEHSAFHSCKSITSISIPNCLTSIESFVFAYCASLTSVTIPNSIISIGDYAFAFCRNLTSVTIPNLDPAPIAINLSTFMEVTLKECMLRVPTSAVSIYQNTFIWKEFNIVGIVGDVFLVNTIANDNTYGNANGNGLYNANETATLTAIAYNGYKFANWTKDGVVVSTKNPYSFIATEDVELVANFVSNVGIENPEIAVVKIYPNPTLGKLKIECGKFEIRDVEIFDVFGKIQRVESWKTEKAIDISHLSTGLYFVKISTEAGEVVRKVVKE